MKAKNVVSVVLLLFVAASVVYLVAGEPLTRGRKDDASVPSSASDPTSTHAAAEPAPTTAPDLADSGDMLAQAAAQPAELQHKLVAYYFHRTQRCRTCLTMEAYAEDALREGLSDAFEMGELEWRAINVEEFQHEHFVEEYSLTASALVMVLLENGEQERWKDLGRVWDLVGDEREFKEYVQDEALAYLEGGSK